MMGYRSSCLFACLLLIVGCSGSGYVEDTPEARGELARSATADALAIELGRELTDVEVEGIVASLRSVLAEFMTESMWADSVADAYAKHFTAAELSGMRDFYASPAGQRMLQLEDTGQEIALKLPGKKAPLKMKLMPTPMAMHRKKNKRLRQVERISRRVRSKINLIVRRRSNCGCRK